MLFDCVRTAGLLWRCGAVATAASVLASLAQPTSLQPSPAFARTLGRAASLSPEPLDAAPLGVGVYSECLAQPLPSAPSDSAS